METRWKPLGEARRKAGQNMTCRKALNPHAYALYAWTKPAETVSSHLSHQ
jgi:hypothetical protein